MKKKKVWLLAIFAISVVCAFAGCGCHLFQGKRDDHEHVYSTEWSYDDMYHYHAAECFHCPPIARDREKHTIVDKRCVVCGCYPTPENSVVNSGDMKFVWLEEDNGYEVVKLKESCTMDSLTIPAFVDGYPVVSVAPYTFMDNTRIKSVTVQEGVKKIGQSAFQNCVNLETVVIPNSVTVIEHEAFYRCVNLKETVIPNGVSKIEEGTFIECVGLQSVTIPDSVTKIESSAFAACYGLTGIVIPDGVISIGESAFAYCRDLTEVIIGGGVKEIEGNAFYACNSITDIYYRGTKEAWKSIVKDENWDIRTTEYVVHCTDGNLDKYGNEVE